MCNQVGIHTHLTGELSSSACGVCGGDRHSPSPRGQSGLGWCPKSTRSTRRGDNGDAHLGHDATIGFFAFGNLKDCLWLKGEAIKDDYERTKHTNRYIW